MIADGVATAHEDGFSNKSEKDLKIQITSSFTCVHQCVVASRKAKSELLD